MFAFARISYYVDKTLSFFETANVVKIIEIIFQNVSISLPRGDTVIVHCAQRIHALYLNCVTSVLSPLPLRHTSSE